MSKPLLALTIVSCVMSISGLVLVPRAMTNSIPAESQVVTTVSLPTYLETLLRAHTFDSSAVGVAASKSQTYQAFEQAIAAGDRIRPEIEYLLNQGSPAGQLYAALLLLRLDQQSGKQALKQLRSDRVMVIRYSGCDRMTMSMSQAVTEISDEHDLELSI